MSRPTANIRKPVRKTCLRPIASPRLPEGQDETEACQQVDNAYPQDDARIDTELPAKLGQRDVRYCNVKCAGKDAHADREKNKPLIVRA